MAQAKSDAETQKKKDETSLVLEILTIVFAFLPFVDDFLPALAGVVGFLPLPPSLSFTPSVRVRVLCVHATGLGRLPTTLPASQTTPRETIC